MGTAADGILSFSHLIFPQVNCRCVCCQITLRMAHMQYITLGDFDLDDVLLESDKHCERLVLQTRVVKAGWGSRRELDVVRESLSRSSTTPQRERPPSRPSTSSQQEDPFNPRPSSRASSTAPSRPSSQQGFAAAPRESLHESSSEEQSQASSQKQSQTALEPLDRAETQRNAWLSLFLLMRKKIETYTPLKSEGGGALDASSQTSLSRSLTASHSSSLTPSPRHHVVAQRAQAARQRHVQSHIPNILLALDTTKSGEVPIR